MVNGHVLHYIFSTNSASQTDNRLCPVAFPLYVLNAHFILEMVQYIYWPACTLNPYECKAARIHDYGDDTCNCYYLCIIVWLTYVDVVRVAFAFSSLLFIVYDDLLPSSCAFNEHCSEIFNMP